MCLGCVLSCFQLFATPWTVACQAPLSVGILQARILEWVAMPSSRGSSQSRDRTQVSCTAGWFFTVWATREAQLSLYIILKSCWEKDHLLMMFSPSYTLCDSTWYYSIKDFCTYIIARAAATFCNYKVQEIFRDIHSDIIKLWNQGQQLSISGMFFKTKLNPCLYKPEQLGFLSLAVKSIPIWFKCSVGNGIFYKYSRT